VLRLSRLSSGISPEAARILAKGEAILSVFQQGQHCPVSLAEQVVLLYALEKGLINGLASELRDRFRKEVFAYVLEHDPAVVEVITGSRELSPKTENTLEGVLRQYLDKTAVTVGEGWE